jgi:glycosyltransferase involved in cell wall biosynthesis
VPEVVRDGVDGVVVPPADAGAMAEAVRGLVRDRERRAALGLAALEKARADFSVDLMVERYLALFAEHGR